MKINKKGFTIIELLIVTVIGLFILEAAYLLYSGSMKLFRDVKTMSDDVQTKIPSIELIARYFDRWGVNVASTGTDCTNYPANNAKCITITAQTGLSTGITCDEVTFWGNLYGTGFVQNVSGSTATLVSCRLSKSTGQNCYYLWRKGVLQNDSSGGSVIPLALNSNLSVNNADCSELTSGSSTNATVNSTLDPWSGSTSKVALAGDIIQRSPHKIRLYCASNSSDGNRNWLYADLTDTASDCNSNEPATPIAPINTFQATLLPSGCTALSGGCTAVNVSVTFRSQSKKYSGEYDTETVQRVFGR
jgi:prepilin-type N-terminal cleavage/methylation domain-containing protein